MTHGANLQEAYKILADMKKENRARKEVLQKELEGNPTEARMNEIKEEIKFSQQREIEQEEAIDFMIQRDNKKNGSGDGSILRSKDSFADYFRGEATDKDLSIGKYIRGALTGKWENAENEKNEFRALSTTTGNVVIPKELSAKIIDITRNKMVLNDIPIVPMKSNNLTLAKIENGPEFGFKEELAAATTSDTTFGKVELKTKMAYGLMKISLELLESAENIDTVIADAMSKALAETIDNAGLYGRGVTFHEPVGFTVTEGINTLAAQEYIDKSKHSTLVKGVGLIRKANYEPTTVVYNSTIDTDINLLTDTTGQPLRQPDVMNTLNKKVSNSIKDNSSLIFDKSKLLMGIQNDIRLEMSRGLGFNDGSVYFRVYSQIDFATLDPKAITLIEYTPGA